MNYASFGRRALAFIFDYILFSLDLIPLGILIYLNINSVSTIFSILGWYFLYLIPRVFLGIVIHTLFISKFGGTPGKLLFGIKIVDEAGNKLSFKNAFFREFVAKRFSDLLLGFGYIWINRNEKKQAWHDLIASTFVVRS